jgi:DNA protecting protein DprA
MVGTRRLTGYGRKNAFSIGYDLAKAGAVIASGMAIGIYGVSHAGSLAAGGVNVAFLGSGIDVCYPEIHQTLARAIVKNGCVMTEYAPGTKPNGRNFPIRNRLIAGISYCAVVIEGNSRSGSLITARYAIEQGKPVYALPGNVDNKTSEVTNLLIKNGAKLITSAMDIVSDIEFVFTGKINPFNITERLDISLDEALTEYKVSAIIPDDKIFSRIFKRSERKSTDKKDKNGGFEENKAVKPITKEPDDIKFDKDTIAIYKMIPLEGEILIDDLASGEYGMQSVMKALLKLEMGRFVVMLPGEKVKRNL